MFGCLFSVRRPASVEVEEPCLFSVTYIMTMMHLHLHTVCHLSLPHPSATPAQSPSCTPVLASSHLPFHHGGETHIGACCGCGQFTFDSLNSECKPRLVFTCYSQGHSFLITQQQTDPTSPHPTPTPPAPALIPPILHSYIPLFSPNRHSFSHSGWVELTKFCLNQPFLSLFSSIILLLSLSLPSLW